MSECVWYDPSCALAWIGAELRAFGLWIYEKVIMGFASLIELFPVPDFLLNLPSYTLPPTLSWAADPFNLPVGIGMVVTAYTARFIIRRIPGVG